MLTEAQLAQRRALLTASDVPAALGIYPWATPVDLWLAKTGRGDGSFESNFRTEMGDAFEPVGLRWLERKLGAGYTVRANKETLVHPREAWFGATPDGDVYKDGQLVGVAETKLVGARVVPRWIDPEGDGRRDLIVPDYVHVQSACQMLVREVPTCWVVALLGADDEPELLTLDHDDELGATILEGARRFWFDNVRADVEPTPRDADERMTLVRAKYPVQKRPMLPGSTVVEDALAAEYAEVRAAIDTLDAREKDIRSRLEEAIADREGIKGPGWKVTWKYEAPYTVKEHVRAGGRKFRFRTTKVEDRR